MADKKIKKEKPEGYVFGRPTKYTKQLGLEIAKKIAVSEIGIRKLCQQNPEWPTPETIMNWKFDHTDFFQYYARAKQIQAEIMVDDCFDIASNESRDKIIGPEGNEIGNSTAVARDRLRIDTIKWNAGKVAPRIYGDARETIIKTRELSEMSIEDQVQYLDGLPYEVKLKIFGGFAEELEKNKK